jgi:nickel-dependent lactate racemase
MRVAIDYGRQQISLDVADDVLVEGRVAAPPAALADPGAAVRDALEQPHDFPALRRALTPDDHVAVLVDERLPRLPALLVPVLEHLVQAGVAAEAITLLCPPPSTGQPWVNELPERFEEVRCEVHVPRDRKRLSFVTTTRKGKQLYFNRTAVDADQLVVLTGRRYDPLLGHGGGEGALYPAFGDEATRNEASGLLSLDVPGHKPWRLHQEATEAAWLLGAPFFVQVIEGPGDAVAEVVAGAAGSLAEGQRLQDAHWRRTLPREVDTVVAAVGGDPARHGFAELADALASASRVLRPNGRVVLLSEASPRTDPGMELLADADDPTAALAEIKRRKDYELRSAWQWAMGAEQAEVFLLSGLPAETVEDLFAFPLEGAGQVQRLVAASEACLFLGDAHKTLALVES